MVSYVEDICIDQGWLKLFVMVKMVVMVVMGVEQMVVMLSDGRVGFESLFASLSLVGDP